METFWKVWGSILGIAVIIAICGVIQVIESYPQSWHTITETDLGKVTDFEIGESCGVTTELGIKYYIYSCWDLDTTKHLIRQEWTTIFGEEKSKLKFE